MIFVATTRNTKCRITFAVLQHSTLLLGEHVEQMLYEIIDYVKLLQHLRGGGGA